MLPPVFAGDGEYYPMCNIHRVVTYAFKIFGNHQKVEGMLALFGVFGNFINKTVLDCYK